MDSTTLVVGLNTQFYIIIVVIATWYFHKNIYYHLSMNKFTLIPEMKGSIPLLLVKEYN